MNRTGLLPDDPCDDVLWKQLLQGDAGSFEQLMVNHTQALYQYGLKFSKDEEFIKDAIQDLFLYIWAHRHALSPTSAVRPYLMASLRRMMHRSSSRNALFEPSPNPSELPFEVEFSVEQKYIRLESTHLLSQKLKKNLDNLPSRQKEVIYLKYYQGLTREQISEVMDITPQTVSNLLQIALRQLRKEWKAEMISSFTTLFNLFIISILELI